MNPGPQRSIVDPHLRDIRSLFIVGIINISSYQCHNHIAIVQSSTDGCAILATSGRAWDESPALLVLLLVHALGVLRW